MRRDSMMVGTRGAVGLLVVALLTWSPEAAGVTLEEAYVAAEENNLSLQLLREQTFQAETLKGQALSALSPQVHARVQYTVNEYEILTDDVFSFDTEGMDPESALMAEMMSSMMSSGDDESPSYIQPRAAWQGTVTLGQLLFSGEIIPTYMSAVDMGRAARLDEASQSMHIRGGVARAYYGLATAREAVAVAELGVENGRHQLELVQRQSDAGLVDSRTLLQAELALARAERDLLDARQQKVSAEESFVRMTGLPRDVEVELPSAVEVPATLEEALSRGQVARPDIQAADWRTSAVRRQRVAKNMEWLPRVTGSFTEIISERPSVFTGGRNFQWQLGLVADWSLWDGGLRVAQGRELASRVRAARLMADQSRQETVEQIRVAWERLGRAAQSLESIDSELNLAEESLRLTEASFGSGSATWLEVEAAELSLQASRLTRITEHMNHDLAAIDLLIAIGEF